MSVTYIPLFTPPALDPPTGLGATSYADRTLVVTLTQPAVVTTRGCWVEVKLTADADWSGAQRVFIPFPYIATVIRGLPAATSVAVRAYATDMYGSFSTVTSTVTLTTVAETWPIIDAKGDLIVGTADNTPARLAVGADGKVLTADSAATGGVSWQTPTGGGGTITVEEVDGSPTDSAVTKIVFPNGTLGIASHIATYTPAGAGLVYPTTLTHTIDYPDGIFNWLGTRGLTAAYTNPAGGGAAGIFVNTPALFTATQINNIDGTRTADKATDRSLDPNNGCAHTQNTASAWWKANFGAGRTFTPTYLGIVGRNGSNEEPRNFKLQGSNDDSAWTDLLTITGAGPVDNAWYSSAVTGSAAYQYLRILQTGNNASGNSYLVLGEVEMWGTIA